MYFVTLGNWFTTARNCDKDFLRFCAQVIEFWSVRMLCLQVASRSVRNQSVPTFLLKLSTRPARLSLVNETATAATRAQQEPSDELYLEARYATLKAVCSQLELALAEARGSAHGFRVMRLIR